MWKLGLRCAITFLGIFDSNVWYCVFAVRYKSTVIIADYLYVHVKLPEKVTLQPPLTAPFFKIKKILYSCIFDIVFYILFQPQPPCLRDARNYCNRYKNIGTAEIRKHVQ
jgi:hypothetical protein